MRAITSISREEQDAFALRSHQRALAAAIDASDRCSCDETKSRCRLIQARRDEGPRRDTSLEALAKLRPAFHASGSVTAGNSSQMSDGASAVLVTIRSLRPGAGQSAAGAIRRVRDRGRAARALRHRTCPGDSEGPENGRTDSPEDIDLIEMNEAFAAQVLACLRNCRSTRRVSTSMAAPSRSVIPWVAQARN